MTSVLVLLISLIISCHPVFALTKYVCRGVRGHTNYAIHKVEQGEFRVYTTGGKSILRVLSLSPRRSVLQSQPPMINIDLVPEEGDIVASILEGEKGVMLIWNKLEFVCAKKRYKP